MVKRLRACLVVSTQYTKFTNVTDPDKQTDRPHDAMGCAYA